MAVSSQPFAGVGVADRESEEAEAEGQHQNVQHGIAPDCAAIKGASMCASGATQGIFFRECRSGKIIGIS
jgi:hypothetical protein